MARQVERLAPFGQENPEPVLVSSGLEVRSKRIVGDNHLKLRLGEAGLDAIGFGLGGIIDDLPPVVDAAFFVSRNQYQGRETLQLRLEDLRPAR